MKISFVIPSHNCAAFLPHAVKSVESQTHKDIELVIVDDFSKDSTGEYLDWLEKNSPLAKENRLHVWYNSKNSGRSFTRNIGNDHATGEVICVLDADDFAAPERAAIVAAKFSQSKIGFFWGSADMMEVLGKRVATFRADNFNPIKAMERFTNNIVHSTVAYRKSIAMEYPYRDGEDGLISKLGIDDWDQQIRIFADKVPHDFTQKVLSAYRLVGTSISALRDNDEVMKVKRKILGELDLKTIFGVAGTPASVGS